MFLEEPFENFGIIWRYVSSERQVPKNVEAEERGSDMEASEV
jgi:hypothetical protein